MGNPKTVGTPRAAATWMEGLTCSGATDSSNGREQMMGCKAQPSAVSHQPSAGHGACCTITDILDKTSTHISVGLMHTSADCGLRDYGKGTGDDRGMRRSSEL